MRRTVKTTQLNLSIRNSLTSHSKWVSYYPSLTSKSARMPKCFHQHDWNKLRQIMSSWRKNLARSETTRETLAMNRILHWLRLSLRMQSYKRSSPMHSVKLQIDPLCKVWKTISKATAKRRKSCVSSSSRETRLFAGSKKKPKSSSLSRGRRQTRWHLVTLLLRRESAMASRLKLKCLQAS